MTSNDMYWKILLKSSGIWGWCHCCVSSAWGRGQWWGYPREEGHHDGVYQRPSQHQGSKVWRHTLQCGPYSGDKEGGRRCVQSPSPWPWSHGQYTLHYHNSTSISYLFRELFFIHCTFIIMCNIGNTFKLCIARKNSNNKH